MIRMTYDTTLKIRKSPLAFSYARKEAISSPIRIIRSSCGTGAGSKRYKYIGVFVSPDDAQFSNNGEVRANIIRRLNPKFNPKDYEFVNDVAVLTSSERKG